MHYHPEYLGNQVDWKKWRLVYDGGRRFISHYLYKRPRERPDEFIDRMNTTYNPAFPKIGIRRIKNAISQRLSDVTREGGPESYQFAMKGERGGVDRQGSTMNAFMGESVLPELLTLSKVGIYVDSATEVNLRNQATRTNQYLYIYQAEDILNWKEREDSPNRFEALLLRDRYNAIDDFGLPHKEKERYRFYKREDGVVNLYLMDSLDQNLGEPDFTLNLPDIPFVIAEISESLLKEVADYQIALLNMASSDVGYVLRSNIPFYVEQFDPRFEAAYKRTSSEESNENQTSTQGHLNLFENDQKKPSDPNNEIEIGSTRGRRYPRDLDQPGFIHPSSEPLEASMKKQESIKDDINMLLDISLINLRPRSASAESRDMADRPMESGLASIGQELNAVENEIAQHWSNYEQRTEPGVVKYPTHYDLRTEEDRLEEADKVLEKKQRVTSNTFRRQIMRRAVEILFAHRVEKRVLDQMFSEIDNAPGTVSESDEMELDLEKGLVSTETASSLRGYANGEAEKAKIDHAERLRRIQDAQSSQSSAARGLPDADPNPDESADQEKENSQNPDTNDTASRRVRQ